jgi:hypothetical protein
MRFDGYCVGDEAVRHLEPLSADAIIAAAREREQAPAQTAELPLAVGDRVRIVRRGWCGSTLFEGDEGTLEDVDRNDPAHPFLVKEQAGEGSWSGGWVAEVERAEQPREPRPVTAGVAEVDEPSAGDVVVWTEEP